MSGTHPTGQQPTHQAQAQHPAPSTAEAPPTRRRRPPPEASENPTAAQAQAAAQLHIDNANTAMLSDLERSNAETAYAVQRRIAAEAAEGEITKAAQQQVLDEQAAKEEHDKALAAFQERQQAVAAAKDETVETPEGMERVTIVSNCTVLRDDGTSATYTTTGSNCGIPGTWDMPKEDADHWYVQQHSDNPPPSLPPQPGTAAAVSIAQRVQAAREQAEYMVEQQAYQAAEAVRQDAITKVKAAMGDAFQQSEPPPPPTPPPPHVTGATGDPPPAPVHG